LLQVCSGSRVTDHSACSRLWCSMCFVQRRSSTPTLELLGSRWRPELQACRRSCGSLPSSRADTVPIDSMTHVPADLFNRLLQEGRRQRGQHRLLRGAREKPRLVRNVDVQSAKPRASSRSVSRQPRYQHTRRGDDQNISLVGRCSLEHFVEERDKLERGNALSHARIVPMPLGWNANRRFRSVSQSRSASGVSLGRSESQPRRADFAPRRLEYLLSTWTSDHSNG